MPRAPRTRGVFVEYEVAARRYFHARLRPKQIEKESILAWNLLTAQDRQNIVDALNQRAQEHEACDKPGADADAAYQAAQDFVSRAPDIFKVDYGEAIQLASEAVQQLRASQDALRSLVQASIVFEQLCQNLPLHDDVKRYSSIERRRADRALLDTVPLMQDMQRAFVQPRVPRRGDGALKILEGWVPAEIHIAKNERRRQAFQIMTINSGDPDAEWVGAWMFPCGGMSDAGLWVKLKSQQVVDRRVVKDTYNWRRDWASVTMWDGDARKSEDRAPYEYTCHRDLSGVPSSIANSTVNVPKLIDWCFSDEEMFYGIDVGYCGNGTLRELILRHSQSQPPLAIPEPFLWRTLHSLAEVGHAMEHGCVPGGEPPEVWKEIVHRDLKPGNVFLDDPTNGFFEAYCTPRVGDFGLAFKTWEDDKLNPQIFLDQACTEGYTAPEQLSYVDARSLEPVDRFKMLSRTNVWGVGMVLYALATLQNPIQPLWLGEGDEDEPIFPDDGVSAEYSEYLTETIRECIQFRPDKRPSFATLLKYFDNAIVKGLDKGMSNLTDADVPSDDDRRLITQNDEYRIGLQRNQLPPL